MSPGRSSDRLRAHYEVEVGLADRLRHATPEQRRRLYSQVYDELYARVPDHPQLTRRADPREQERYAEEQVALVRRLLPTGGSYVEIGAGDCATIRRVSPFARTAIAVEVSREIIPDDLPANVGVAISDGVTVPVPPGSADLVYSNQLMEHLHPDDALEQLTNIAAALRQGGRYLCVTPNRLTGPHDISVHFDRTARGFHLREYSYQDLDVLLRRAGFSELRVVERAGGALDRVAARVRRVTTTGADALGAAGRRVVLVPLAPYLLVERFVRARGVGGPLPRPLHRLIDSVKIVATR